MDANTFKGKKYKPEETISKVDIKRHTNKNIGRGNFIGNGNYSIR